MKALIPWEPEKVGGRFSIREWEIDPERTALLVVDVQRGYVERDMGVGPLIQRSFPDVHEYYYPRLTHTVLPNIAKLQDFFRRKGAQIIYTRMGMQLPDARDLGKWSWRHVQAVREDASTFAKDQPEHDLATELTVTSNDLVIDKNSGSPFASTAIDQILHNMGIENLVIVGIGTNAAVENAARDAGDRGYCPMVVEDASAAYLPTDHEAALATATWWVARTTESIIETFDPLLANV